MAGKPSKLRHEINGYRRKCAACGHARSQHGPDCFKEVTKEGQFCKCPRFVEAKGQAA